ncbi:MAG TPA: PAS domain-containing protein [Methylorubrum populi]|uniref:Oxygen sensor histidine kinase NreB n=1 Tax=Methylorubrum populi TaxID=223967 RepID=A0A921JGV0_9HYPH|nr:PAS domain-containing protein [Methylorubrum populi]
MTITEGSRARKLERALLDNIPDMAWLKDRDSRYLAISATYLDVLGMTEAEVIGRRPDEIWPADIAAVYLRTDHAVLRSGKRRRYEEARQGPDGTLRWYDTIKSPIRDEGNHIIGTVGISRDITNRKAAEDELIASREQLRKLAEFEQRAREQERARIARELHDELGQTLTAIKMDLVWMKDRLDEPALVSARIERLIALADRSVVDLRRIATELRPLILDELGLRAAIEWLTQSMAERCGLPITLVFDEGATYDPDVSTAAFRIVQEALTNVLRHGAATGVAVRARNAGDALLIEVSDNGRGIDRSASTRGRLGLAGMRERARLLGGSVAIDGEAGAGTTVRVRLPLAGRPRRKAAR